MMIQKLLRSSKEHIHRDSSLFQKTSIKSEDSMTCENPSKIAYSKLIIFKVMNLTYWNQDPYTKKKPFQSPLFLKKM